MSERAFTEEELREYAACYQEALQQFGLNETSPPQLIIDAIDAYVDKWQRKLLNPQPNAKKRNATHAAVCCGVAWGNQIVRQFGWLWTCRVLEGNSYYAVVPPDRALVIYPMTFTNACLNNPHLDCTVALSFNMMATGDMGGMPAGGYEDVMQGVRRIVPKK